MNLLTIAREFVGEPKKNGSAYNSPCPFCGGNQRFVIWPDKGEHGAYWCRQCGKKGDAINLLMEKKGMSYKEAAEYVGKELKPRQKGRAPRASKEQAPDFVPREIADPAELWQAKAAAFMEHCHKVLLSNAEQLAWLAARGITVESVKRFKLGWNPKRVWRKRKEWGIPDKIDKQPDGTEKVFDLFALHLGLVIPYIIEERVHRVRIRRPEEGLDDRYHVVPPSPPGSGMAPMTIWPVPLPEKGRGAWAVVESELDAILIAQDAGDLVGVSALGSVSMKPDTALGKALQDAACILVAIDFDVKEKDPGAAGKRWPWWQAQYAQADRWIVPRGKDPGEYFKEGGDIREWILKGLPYGLRPVAKMSETVLETKRPQGETDGAKSETQGCEIAKNANSQISGGEENITLPAPANRSEAEPLAPYDGSWPPITKEQAREMGHNFHETKCEACRRQLILLWPEGQKPVLIKKCFECLKPKDETRRTKWKTAI